MSSAYCGTRRDDKTKSENKKIRANSQKKKKNQRIQKRERDREQDLKKKSMCAAKAPYKIGRFD